MTKPLPFAMLTFVPVLVIALFLPGLLSDALSLAMIAEMGFAAIVANRLVQLKREQGSVPFRPRRPFVLTLGGIVFYGMVALGSPSPFEMRLFAVAGALFFAASKLWFSKGPLWPYLGSPSVA